MIFRDVQVRNPQQCSSASRNVDDRWQRLREVHNAVGGLSSQGTGRHRIRIATTIKQKILVLHISEGFRVEGHADKMEVRIEAVDLQRIFNVVLRAAVAIVVGVLF